MSSYQISKKIRDAVITQLRRGFAQDPRYTYSKDLSLTKIAIVDVTPLQAIKYPTIIINSTSTDEMRFLDDDYGYETKTKFVRFAGLNSRVSIEVATLDTLTKDEVTDRVYEILKLYKDNLADAGIAIFKISLSPERRQFIGDRWFYTSGLDLSCYSEWKDEEDSTNITKVNTTGTVDPSLTNVEGV